jgi:3-dehydroquinate dehydratase
MGVGAWLQRSLPADEPRRRVRRLVPRRARLGGRWSHYSYAIRDALELLDAPIVEVHLSNVDEREDWRKHSVLSDLAAKRVIGKGPDGYREALEFLVAAS